MMKKILLLFFACVLCLSVAACTKNDSGMDEETEFVIESFFAQENYVERTAYLEENYEKYPLLTNDELEALIVGDWLEMNVEPYICEDWWVYEYESDGIRYQRSRICVIDGETKELDEWKTNEEGFPTEYAVEDGTLCMYWDEGADPTVGGKRYEFRKMHDNFYLVIQTQTSLSFETAKMYIYAQLDTTDKLVYQNEDWEEYNMYIHY